MFPNPASSITGDFRIPNPTFDYTSAFDWVMSGPFLPQIYATSYDIQGNPIGTDISSSLAMTQVRTAQIMKRFDNANFIVGSSTVTFGWENPKMYLIPETLKQLYGLGTTYTFTKAQSLGSLETGLLKNTVNDGTGTLSTAISGEDYVNTAEFPIGNSVMISPLYPAPGMKLIAPMFSFKYRRNKKDEFKQPVANTIDIFDGTAAKFENIAITGIIGGLTIPALLRIAINGEIDTAIPDIDYALPMTVEQYYRDITNYIQVMEQTIRNLVDNFTIDIQTFFNQNRDSLLSLVTTTIAAATAAVLVEATLSASSSETSAISSSASAVEAKTAATEATASASSAASSAAAASAAVGEAEAAVSVAVVASIISGELGSAVSDARDAADNASSSADDAKRSLLELQDQNMLLQGDINGSGIIKTGILNATLAENLFLPGNAGIRIPSGTNLERPIILSPGIIRFNTDLN